MNTKILIATALLAILLLSGSSAADFSDTPAAEPTTATEEISEIFKDDDIKSEVYVKNEVAGNKTDGKELEESSTVSKAGDATETSEALPVVADIKEEVQAAGETKEEKVSEEKPAASETENQTDVAAPVIVEEVPVVAGKEVAPSEDITKTAPAAEEKVNDPSVEEVPVGSSSAVGVSVGLAILLSCCVLGFFVGFYRYSLQKYHIPPFTPPTFCPNFLFPRPENDGLLMEDYYFSSEVALTDSKHNHNFV